MPWATLILRKCLAFRGASGGDKSEMQHCIFAGLEKMLIPADGIPNTLATSTLLKWIRDPSAITSVCDNSSTLLMSQWKTVD